MDWKWLSNEFFIWKSLKNKDFKNERERKIERKKDRKKERKRELNFALFYLDHYLLKS